MRAQFISPELCKLVEEPPQEKGWVFEEKFDGIRCIAVKKNGKVTLYSRNRKKQHFPEIAGALENQKTKDFVIDGEIVAFEGKVSSFSKLQQRKQEKVKAYYYAFDMLIDDGEDLRKKPLVERKKRLKQLLCFKSPIRYTSHHTGSGAPFYKKAEKKGLEGIIAKKAESTYLSKRSPNWRKIKCTNRQELVIGGFTEPQGSRIGFGALLVGYYEGGSFRYAGKVGTGYSHKTLESLSKKLERIERSSSPFQTKPREKGAHFVRPSLVCEVGFTQWTKDGKLRHPTFLGLRKDKSAKEVKKER